jgi:hypothetical protein
VRRHAAAFDIPESEGGVMPPHSKAPSAHQPREISGEAPDALGRPPSFARSFNLCHPWNPWRFVFRMGTHARTREVSGEPVPRLRRSSLKMETSRSARRAPWSAAACRRF